MKRFYSTLFILLGTFTGFTQAVLNEIYAYPGAGNHEFFELYNTSTSDIPISVDDYMLVTYFDDGKSSGFYVMDLPNMLMYPKGYFVGSAAIPFNYQGNLNSTASDFNWNDPSFRNGSTNGYLRKWVKSKAFNPSDKNIFYDEEPVPNDFNDFFSKIKGNGASFNTFLFKNGVLMNSFLGGTGGTAIIPQEIIDMPVLMMESRTAAGTKYYATNFSKYKAIEAENVIQDIGSDNGYMRSRDGMCGTWEKSSAQSYHTPKTTNGSWSQMDIEGSVTLDTHISRGLTAVDSSFISYRIVAAPTIMFPAEIYVYADNGSVNDEWDANDDFLKADTVMVANDSTYTTSFLPQDQELIMVIKTVQGCYDQVRLILNPTPVTTTLPIRLKAFTGRMRNDHSLLEWVVSGNETGLRFEVERSPNGKDFSRVSMVSITSKQGEEYYTYQEPLPGSSYYRLKIINKNGSSNYSPVVFVKDASMVDSQLLLFQNPVDAVLVFSYQSAQTKQSRINIYNAVGVKLFTTLLSAQKGSNTYTINLDPKITPGTYLLEVVNNGERRVERFIKR